MRIGTRPRRSDPWARIAVTGMPTETKRASRQIGTASSAGTSALDQSCTASTSRPSSRNRMAFRISSIMRQKASTCSRVRSLIAKRRPGLPINRPATTTAIGPRTWIQNDSE